jgi:hypothetical protein
MLAEWQPSYKRGAAMQASLALVGFALGWAAWWQTAEWRWLVGALFMIAGWPYTMIVIMPTNRKLLAADPLRPGPDTAALVEKWGRLHGGRTALGVAASLSYLWASL